ncbi:uncharacterized protein LOC135371060 isoform X3 [Ornithodoros turicata]|uniref:uncharacterized protein LOC135371060 isoform X3 n=1 Tax=Ornithodoros turicata TaxID=34597 RepID=UPI0031390A99
MNDAMDRDVATMASSIELSVKDYISTLTGILNLLEVYVLFLTCAGMAYTIGSVCVIKESKSTPVFAILSVTIGGIYYIHAVYAVIRLL